MSLASEVAAVRAMYVDGAIGAWVNRREGEFTTQEYDAYEAARYRWWRDTFPELNSLLVSHPVVGKESDRG